MKPRLLTNYLIRDAGYCPVVTLTGPRQSGKTTIAQNRLSRLSVSVSGVDRPAPFAQEDPRGFLAKLKGPVIFNEIQHVPDLMSYIQSMVDDDPTPGRFVLTGSDI